MTTESGVSKLDGIRTSDGMLPPYAWPGGYVIAYVVADGELLCAKCANGENGSLAFVGEEGSPDMEQWRIIGYDVREGVDVDAEDYVPEYCAHCNVDIDTEVKA